VDRLDHLLAAAGLGLVGVFDHEVLGHQRDDVVERDAEGPEHPLVLVQPVVVGDPLVGVLVEGGGQHDPRPGIGALQVPQ
jgi:hypothetical protein